MKKIAYIAAALVAVVGCSKNEVVPETAGSNDLTVSLAVGSTKAVFDGDSHIKFEEKDAMYAAIATEAEPNKGIEVAGPSSLSCVASLTVDTKTSVFSGTFKSMEPGYVADKYWLYGVFPYSALYSTSSSSTQDLEKWTVKLINDQSDAIQTSWAPKADVMVVKPVLIEAKTNVSEASDKYFDASAAAQVELAHLFGFAQIKFADIPAEYADLVVKSVTIQTTDDSPAKYLAGQYTLDMTKDIEDVELTEGRSYNMYDNITLKGDGETKISDYTAWFVANQGNYNVKITVATKKANFIFERQGLEIKRGKIASPTVHYKATDTADILDVVLADGESWSMTEFTYSNVLNAAGVSKQWGDGDKKMAFAISYPGTTNGVSPGTFYGDKNGQKLAGNLVNGGKIVLSSEAEFKGMKYIKMNLGIYTNDVEADFHIGVDNGKGVVELGKFTIAGTNKNSAGTDCYVKTTTETENGLLVLTVDNLPKDEKGEYFYVQEYLGGIVVNPAPELVVEFPKINVAKDAGTVSFFAEAFATEDIPSVSVAEDAASWLTATYADSKVTVTVAENTGAKRTGTVTVTLGETLKKEVAVVQASATAVEYKLTVTPKDVADAYTASGASGTAKLEFTVDAVGVADASKKLPVALVLKSINSAAEASFVTTGSMTCAEAVGEIKTVSVNCNKKHQTSNYADISLKLSKDGQTWVTAPDVEIEGDLPYVSTATNTDSDYTWFDIKATTFTKVTVYSFEVTFIAD